jgi:hypothetical protein
MASILRLALLVGLAACGSSAPAPTQPPLVVGSSPAASPVTAPDGPKGSFDASALTVDGVKLGAPISALLARAPYDQPCDIDPVDKKKSTLYFWAPGECKKAPPFPGGTTLVIVTPRSSNAARAEQPMTLVAWAGGTYFDDKTNLPVHIGASSAQLEKALGTPTATKKDIELRGGQPPGRALSWGRVHALVVGDKAVVLAMGDLDVNGEGELAETLQRLHHHHLKFTKPDR